MSYYFGGTDGFAWCVDLIEPMIVAHPFTTPELSWHLDLLRMFRSMSADMATPQRHNDDVRTYLPTQLVSAIIRRLGYLGVRYQSALDWPSGRNLALFDPSIVTFGESRLLRVTEVKVYYEERDAWRERLSVTT